MKKLVIGIIVSAVFIYFSIGGIDFAKVLLNLKDIRYSLLLPTVLIFLFVILLRSLRWEVILSPIEKVNQKKLFPITCIGFMGIALMPLRIGEFVRQYLVSTKSNIPLSSAIATILVERVFDMLVLIAIMAVVIMNGNYPPWIIKSGYIIFIILNLVIICLYLFYFKTEQMLRLLTPVLKVFPKKFKEALEGLIKTFAEGFTILASPKKLIFTVLFSVCIWFFSGFAIYSLFYLSGLSLSLVSAFAVLVITMLGVSLPSAPGFLGNFQFACIFALSTFNVSRSEAFAFSMVYYLIAIGINVLAGLLFLPFHKFSLTEMKKVFTVESLSLRKQ